MKAIFFGLIAASICLVVVFLASRNSAISRWADSSYIVWDLGSEVGVPRVLSALDVKLADLPAIASAMSQSSAEVTYAAFAFCPPDCLSDEDVLNVQLSIDDGEIGMDWVLLGPRNVQDREQFIAFAEAEGFNPALKRENEVSFLRVDSDEAVELVVRTVTVMYQVPPNETLSLYHEGFDWPQD